jgi:hypothetical protein
MERSPDPGAADSIRRRGGGARRGRTAPDDSGDFDISDLGGLGDIFRRFSAGAAPAVAMPRPKRPKPT